jgi:competence protein ComEA
MSNGSETIQVYIVGAVKRPGVYTLDANARIYQLLKAAGGPQANANLVAINLAAALKDGEEVYIPVIGETTPANNSGIVSNDTPTAIAGSSGQLVNVNTASATELRQQLHISTQTADKIITYRTQHGPYTSIAQLANVVSKSIYDKIKDKVTV